MPAGVFLTDYFLAVDTISGRAFTVFIDFNVTTLALN
jgi:hypothetical protein